MNHCSERRQSKMDGHGESKKTTITVLRWVLVCATLRGCFADVPRFWENAPSRLGSSIVLPVSGNVYPLGYYSVRLDIGHPPKAFEMDIDTGGDLTWVQCDYPCTGCTLPVDRLYKPEGNFVDREDPLCAALISRETPSQQCLYNVEYAGGSLSHGALVNDSFHFKLRDGSHRSPFMTFGCGYNQKYDSKEPPSCTAGVLGLGNGKVSILSQLSGLSERRMRNVVGHCLSAQGGGFLFLGDDPTSSGKVVWVPISDDSSAYGTIPYLSRLAKFWVRLYNLDEKFCFSEHYEAGPAELLHNGKSTGVKGLRVVFDSGSSYTYFNPEAYEAVLNQVRADLKGTPLDHPPEKAKLPVCWKGAKPLESVNEVKDYFKPFALSFTKGNAQFQLLPEAYLIIIDGKACLGILRGEEEELGVLNLIGDISMLDRMVIYDNEKKQIGWVVENCHSFGSSELFSAHFTS